MTKENKFVIRHSSFVINRCGFTLIESLIVIGIFAFVILAVAPFLRSAQKSWEADSELSNMLAKARTAMDKMRDELSKTNAIIDATDVKLSTNMSLDSNYITFATSGEEIILDDRNGDFATYDVGWVEGTTQGGYAGDYLFDSNAAQSYASWGINTILKGGYDVYNYIISTRDMNGTYSIIDDNALEVSTGYCYNSNPSASCASAKWDKRFDSSIVNLTTGNPATGYYDDYVGLLSTKANMMADGIKLVYKDKWHKVLLYDYNNKKIIFTGCPSSADATESCPNNSAGLSSYWSGYNVLAENVYYVNGDINNKIFNYFQADGTTVATNPQDVSLIRIQFEIRDPDGKVNPYVLKTEVRVKGELPKDKIIINEINYMPPETVIFADTFEPGGCTGSPCPMTYNSWNNWFDNFDGGVNGWTPASADWGQCNIGGSCNVGTNDPLVFDATSPSTWAMSPGGNYAASLNTRLVSPTIAIPNITESISARFYYLRRTGGGGNKDTDDKLYFEVNDDAGGNCDATVGWKDNNGGVAILDMGAEDAAWQLQQVGLTLDLYKGCTIQMGLRFLSDVDVKRYRLYIENIAIRAVNSGNNNNLGSMVTAPAAGNLVLWEKGNPAFGCKSGVNCYGTFINKNYPNYMDASLVVNSAINLSGYDYPFLEFWMYTDTEAGFDGAIVQIASNGDAGWPNPTTWHQIGTTETAGVATSVDSGCTLTSPYDDFIIDYDGLVPTGFGNPLSVSSGYCDGSIPNDQRYAWLNDRTSWIQVRANLSPWFPNSQIKIRIRFGSDSSNVAPGFFIDNLEVTNAPDIDYEWIELYNPTSNSVDVSNWRIKTQTSYGDAPTTYDIISGDERPGNNNATTIGGYGYAIVTTNSSTAGCNNDVYDNTKYTIPADGLNTRRLNIDDCRFGYNSSMTDGYLDGFTDDFGKIELLDNNNKLVDAVLYNTAFYDDAESYTAGVSVTDFYKTWSTQNYGDTTDWYICDPVYSTSYDNTLGQYSLTTGKAFCLKNGASAENYANKGKTSLISPVINFNSVTASQSPKLRFYYRFEKSGNNNDDGFLVQYSQTGATNFVQCVANDATGLFSTEVSPPYDGAVSFTGACDCGNPKGVLECQNAFYVERTNTFRKVDIDLSALAGTAFSSRFYFGAQVAGGNFPLFIDDIVFYYNWGGNGTGTLERKYWQGNSNDSSNWAQSTNITAPNIGTPGAKNTQTP